LNNAIGIDKNNAEKGRESFQHFRFSPEIMTINELKHARNSMGHPHDNILKIKHFSQSIISILLL